MWTDLFQLFFGKERHPIMQAKIPLSSPTITTQSDYSKFDGLRLDYTNEKLNSGDSTNKMKKRVLSNLLNNDKISLGLHFLYVLFSKVISLIYTSFRVRRKEGRN